MIIAEAIAAIAVYVTVNEKNIVRNKATNYE